MAHARRLPADVKVMRRMVVMGLMLVMGIMSMGGGGGGVSGSSSSGKKTENVIGIRMAATDSLKYWKWALGENVELPETLATKLSPLTSSQLQHYSQLMEQGKLLASNGAGASLCKAAGLVCAANSRLVSPDCGGGHQSYARVEVDEATFNKMAEDPDLIDFFRESTILVAKQKKGSTLRLPNLQVQKLEPRRKFLPRQLARPFELNNHKMTDDSVDKSAQESLVKALPLGPRSSPLMVHVMDCVSPRCSAPAMLGESKSCVSSLEEMADLAAATFGKERGHVASVPPQDESGSLRTAHLLDAQLIARPGSPILTCHDNMYPYQMYYCHAIHNTKLYKLTFQLVATDKEEANRVVEKVATCHMDTSQWPARHPAFAVLHSHPGDGEACHYIVKDDILFYVPATTSA